MGVGRGLPGMSEDLAGLGWVGGERGRECPTQRGRLGLGLGAGDSRLHPVWAPKDEGGAVGQEVGEMGRQVSGPRVSWGCPPPIPVL